MIVTYYNSTTGQIMATLDQPDEVAMLPDPYIIGSISGQQFYIDVATTTPVPLPKKPFGNDTQYKFNWTTKQWDTDLPATDRYVRSVREQLFKTIDKMNPVWYDSLTTEQQTELKQYRQALLDITKQEDYPLNVVYPQKPSFL